MYESISFKAQGHVIEFLNEFLHPVTSDNLSAVELIISKQPGLDYLLLGFSNLGREFSISVVREIPTGWK